MKKEYSGIPAKVYPLIEQAAADAGCFIWDVEFVKEGADRVLRITIDTEKETGIELNDCEAVHRAVDPILDEADPIDTSYMLQVTSPGIERELTMPWHVEAFIGAEAKMKLFSPVNGKRIHTGTIAGIGDDLKITLTTPDGDITADFDSVAKLRLVYNFDFN